MRKSTAVAEKAARTEKKTAKPRGRKVAADEASSDRMASGKMVGAVVGAIKILRYLSEAQQAVAGTNLDATLSGAAVAQFGPAAKELFSGGAVRSLAKQLVAERVLERAGPEHQRARRPRHEASPPHLRTTAREGGELHAVSRSR